MRPTTRRLLAVAGSLAVVGAVTLAPPSAAATTPGYTIYHAPTSLAGYDDAAEPTIGSNWTTGNAMYQAGLSTFKVSFDEATGAATWTDKSSLLTSITTLDPILYTDPKTDRTFVSQLTAACSLLAYSDNDGDSWTQNPIGCGAGTSGDHQTVGGGTFAPTGGVGVGYEDIVYYCAQQIAAATCASSRDGGLTFGPGVPIYTIAQCSGLHGHVMVAPNDGTAYVPNADCGGRHGVSVSTNNGATWAVRTVPGSATQFESDPAVGVGTDGTMYLGFQQASTDKGVNETYPAIAVSKDRGASFQNVKLNIGQAHGIKNIQFPRVVAGDGNRAAFAFLGTTTGGDDQASSFPGVWHLYISTTYDGGATWDTVQATPDNDPVQRGCIWLAGGSNPCRNLLDFMGSTVDKQGRVLIGYADGCDASCAAGKRTLRADAVIARQSSGLGLFSAFDGGGTTLPPTTASPAPTTSSAPSPAPTSTATVPGAPTRLSAVAAKGKGIQLSWTAPASDGGSALTGYVVYRDGVEHVTVSGTSHKDTTNMTSGRTYTYTVAAKNSVGPGPKSEPASATAK